MRIFQPPFETSAAMLLFFRFNQSCSHEVHRFFPMSEHSVDQGFGSRRNGSRMLIDVFREMIVGVSE